MVRGRGGTSAAVVRRVRHARADVFLVAAALLILGPIVAPWHAQSASRMALTDSLAEHGTVEVRREPLGVDYSVRPGNRQRSDKAPGQPVLAVPFYLAARAAGAEST